MEKVLAGLLQIKNSHRNETSGSPRPSVPTARAVHGTNVAAPQSFAGTGLSRISQFESQRYFPGS